LETRVARVALDGTLLDSAPIVMSVAAPTYAPSVVWNGSDFTVVWAEYSVIVSRHLSEGGVPLGPPSRATAVNKIGYGPHVANDGVDTQLAWQTYSGTTGAPDLVYARLARDGGLLDAEQRLNISAYTDAFSIA